MGWTIRGEHIVVQQPFGTQLVSELYRNGLNLVPRVLLREDFDYGTALDGSRLQIEKDRYLSVSSRLREGIRSDPRFKAELHHTTWWLLGRFTRAVRGLEAAAMSSNVTPELLESTLSLGDQALALTEFNGMLPMAWYRERLHTLAGSDGALAVEDFAHSAIIPHRTLVYRAKLQLAIRCMEDPAKAHSHAERFTRRYGYLEYSQENPLLPSPAEDTGLLLQEVQSMIAGTDSRRELVGIRARRRASRDRYHFALAQIAATMERQGEAPEAIQNFVSSLALISLAATEEEYRHIWQARLWRTLRAIVLGLDFPLGLVSRSELLRATRRRPEFTPVWR